MGLSADVTRREISLGNTRDSTTGWRPINYLDEIDGEPNIIEMLLFPRGGSGFYTPAGYYGKIDYLGQCADVVQEYDQILDSSNQRYEVKYIHIVKQLDNFIRRDCVLTLIPLWQASPTTQTGPSGMPTDARSNTKTWVDTYANVDHTWITENDGTSAADFATIYANPPYPLELEFRAPSAPVHGLYTLGGPTSTPMMDPVTKAPYGYSERVPIKGYTIDSAGVTGVILANKMEKELRYVAEEYMEGSLRSAGRMQPREIQLGSTILYETTFDLIYERGTT